MTGPIINQLEAALDETVQLLSSLTSEEANKVPFEGSWTAAQVAQHLFLSEDGMDQLLQTPAEVVDRQPDANAAELKKMFLNFEIKMKSPDFIVPEDKEFNKEELEHSLQEVKSKMLDAANTTDLSQEAPLPPGHPLQGNTKLEIVHFVTYHTMRHNQQIKNMMPMVK